MIGVSIQVRIPTIGVAIRVCIPILCVAIRVHISILGVKIRYLLFDFFHMSQICGFKYMTLQI